MISNNPSVYVFNSHDDAEAAIRALSQSGFDVKKLSLVGKGYHSEEHPIGFYTVGDKVKTWGTMGLFCGSIWGLLFAPAAFFLPGLGIIALAGPFAQLLVGVLEGALVVGGVSALAAALSQIGVPNDEVVKYETALKADKFLLMIHGTADERAKAHTVLGTESKHDITRSPAYYTKLE